MIGILKRNPKSVFLICGEIGKINPNMKASSQNILATRRARWRLDSNVG